jgi:hypothetical protein
MLIVYAKKMNIITSIKTKYKKYFWQQAYWLVAMVLFWDHVDRLDQYFPVLQLHQLHLVDDFVVVV